MAKTFEYNDQTGTWYSIEDDSSGDLIIKTIQDVDPVVDYTKRVRNEGTTDKAIKRDGIWHYATLPAAVWLKMKEEGIDIFDKNDEKRMLKYINREVPHLKTTYLKHE